MSLPIYIKRILHDKMKLALILILLLIPQLDLGQIVHELMINPEVEPPDPRYATFSALYTVGTNHFLHKIMFWFLPVFLLIITGEESIEDFDLGYNHVVASRIGKKSYILNNFKNAFLCSFCIIAAALTINFALLMILFDYGGHIPMEISDEPANTLYGWLLRHPITANINNIVLSAALAGIISWIGNALAVSLHDRKLVYCITFFIWFIFVQMDGGLMNILHPFVLMELPHFLMAAGFIFGGYLLIAATITIVEIRSDEI